MYNHLRLKFEKGEDGVRRLWGGVERGELREISTKVLIQQLGVCVGMCWHARRRL